MGTSKNVNKGQCKTVAKIGGCDKNYCGVEFTDGTYTGNASRPVIGMLMCDYNTGYYMTPIE